jgi:hypothetical protein
MLSIASVISVPINSATPSLPTADTLFQTALHHIHKLTTITPSHAYHLAGGGKRSHIFLCQAYVLMSLRQTRMGDKASAYLYASMASGMCLELGLHRRVGWGSGATGKKQSQVSGLAEYPVAKATRLLTSRFHFAGGRRAPLTRMVVLLHSRQGLGRRDRKTCPPSCKAFDDPPACLGRSGRIRTLATAVGFRFLAFEVAEPGTI